MKNLQSSTKFQVLEINLISAQQLKLPGFSLRKNHQIYAVVWIDPKQKLRSRAKPGLLGNPLRNDKFMFMVDPKCSIYSWSITQLVFEFYCIRRFGKDRLIGTSRVLLGSLENYCYSRYCEGMMGTFKAFHVRHPNGDPDQRVLNIGILILDGLLCQVISDLVIGMTSTVDFQKLMIGRTTRADEKVCTIAI